MPIKMQCPACSRRFSVWEELAGQVVECPQCSTRLEVAAPAQAAAETAAAAMEPEQDDEFELRLAPVEERPVTEFALDHLTAESAAPATSNPAVSPPATAKSPPGGSATACPECGSPLGADGMLCTECGYHLVLKRKVNADLDDLQENDKVGFDRWLADQLEAGESVETVLFWLDAVLAVVLVLVALVGGFLGTVLALAAAGGYAYWRVTNRRKRQQDGQVMGLRGPLWIVVLQVLRLASWRTLSRPLQAPRLLDLRNAQDADEVLAESDLSEVEVIDCGDSSLSDEGLLSIGNARGLKFLVASRTRVTREALCRLQDRRRDCWIWY